jgi:hypothetical protein
MALHAQNQAPEEARSLKPFEENDMIKRAGWLAVVLAVPLVGGAGGVSYRVVPTP